MGSPTTTNNNNNNGDASNPYSNDNERRISDSGIIFDDHDGSDRIGKNSNHKPQSSSSKHRRILRMDSRVHLPRLIRRDYAYDQSSNKVRISNENTQGLSSLLLKDWFHVLLRIHWYYTLGVFLLVWYAMIWAFAAWYQAIDGTNFNRNKDCGLGEPGVPISMSTAYAFSLETCTTVGYGLPGSANGFFNSDCEGLQIAITLQMIWSMLSNAFLVSFFFSQMSKCDKRSIQLVFSKKLCVNVEDGRVCLNVRCYDLDSSHPLVECHARIYLIDHHMKLHPLRLIEPNDDLGGVLYPSAPTTIVHHIDHHSALSPRQMPLVEKAHGLHLRSVDSGTANREEIICPVCGEGYGSYERLRQHVQYQRIVEEQDDYPVEGTHRGFELPEIRPVNLAEVQRHIEGALSEIVVVVEAIDPQLSGTFQAVQSYTYEDIEFGADFEPCMFARREEFAVDLRKFHGVIYHDDMYSEEPSVALDARENSTNTTAATIHR